MNPPKYSPASACSEGQLLLNQLTGVFNWTVSNQAMRLLHLIVMRLIHFVFLLCALLLQVTVLFITDDMNEFFGCFNIATASFNNIVKMIILKRSEHEIMGYLRQLNMHVFDAKDSHENGQLHGIRQNCLYMCYSFMALACAGSTCTMMKPFFSGDSKNELSFPMWTPLDISTRNYNYWTMFAYETIAIFTMSVVHAGIDCFFYAVFASIHYEICVLGHRLCELGQRDTLKPHECDIDKYDEIVELIQIHVQIDKNIQDCQNIFNVILFIQVVQTVVGLSFTSVGLLHIDPFSFAFVSTFSILCLIGYQTFLYCWLGSNIINSYHDLSTNCFFANFAIFNKRSKLALLLMMQLTAARPKSIVGESVLRFVFSMETFVTVVKTSYSYVALMSRIK